MNGKRQEIVEIAKTWLNTPYLAGARVKGAGCDCGLFMMEVFEEAELIPHVEVGYYAHDHHLHSIKQQYLSWVERFAHRIDTPPQPGDILLYDIGKCISHGSIVLDYPLMIHSVLGQGVILSNATEERWLSRQAFVYSVLKDGD